MLRMCGVLTKEGLVRLGDVLYTYQANTQKVHF